MQYLTYIFYQMNATLNVHLLYTYKYLLSIYIWDTSLGPWEQSGEQNQKMPLLLMEKNQTHTHN